MPSGVYSRKFTLHDRFWSRVNKTDTCWIWTGTSLAVGGYGYISHKRKMYRAHRLSYEWTKGSIPKGMFICHTCDNPKCVKPEHLFLGTPADNVHDMIKKGRDTKAVGEKASKSKLTPIQVLEIVELFPKPGISYAEMGRRYGVKHSSIINIVRGKSWRHIVNDEKN